MRTLPATLMYILMGSAALIKAIDDVFSTATIVNGDPGEKTESRQNYLQYNFPHYYRPHRYPNLMKPGHSSLNYGYGNGYGNGQGYGYGTQQQGLMDVLETVAARDELLCVSKILCEMASGENRGSNGYKKLSNFINLDSMATLLSGVDDTTASSLVKFGKAFLLGYTAKHITSCQYAYPRCPSDPDKLVHYLNNQNGGLFRFFDGGRFPQSQQQQPQSQRKIQSWGVRPLNVAANLFHIYDYDSASKDKRQYAWQFPSYYAEYNNQIHNYENDSGVQQHEKEKSLKFPNEQEHGNGYIRTQVYFPDNHLKTDEESQQAFIFKDFK